MQLAANLADVPEMMDVVNPVWPPQHPMLALDHSLNASSLSPASAASSFGSCSTGNRLTPLSTPTTASASSSRRESISNSTYSLTSTLSPSSATGSIRQINHDQSFGLSYPSTQLSYEGSTMPTTEERLTCGIRDGQINILADDLFQNPLFTGSQAELSHSEVSSRGYGIGPNQHTLAFHTPAYAMVNECHSLEAAAPSYVESSIADNLSQASVFVGSGSTSSNLDWSTSPSTMDKHGMRLRCRANRDRNHGCKKGQKHLSIYDHPGIMVVGRADKKPHKCTRCSQTFARQEHRERHKLIHPEEEQIVYACPMSTFCKKEIQNRPDNMKAHIKNTHFKPSEKKKTEKINYRVTMKQLYEYHQAGIHRDAWMKFLRKSGPLASPDQLWKCIRDIDDRWPSLLNGKMTIHDRVTSKNGDNPKPTRYWTTIGWSILEAQTLCIKDLAPEMDVPSEKTLYDVDPRIKAMMDGTMKVEDTVHLGVDMMTTKGMGLQDYDPRWQALINRLMSAEDAEKNGVSHLLHSRRRRCAAARL